MRFELKLEKFFTGGMAFTIAVLALFALCCGMVANTMASDFQTKGELYRTLWLAHYQLSLENRENEAVKEQSEKYLDLTIQYANQSTQWGMRGKIWHLSAQAFTLSLVLLLTQFSIHKERWKKMLNWATFILYIYALLTLLYPILI